ncbi:hypothetical protein BN2476_700010 [Paraburkholderia piptadeniae]|uniref:Uncharacterized protein n=1 Tax=Paraburkholderia piptadeniae TaxID=1701573 RepID=A0A1N7SQE0_9BURK|nr:hypothetical protein BN2476_700010 [Paraburkholderia piptadeniae]
MTGFGYRRRAALCEWRWLPVLVDGGAEKNFREPSTRMHEQALGEWPIKPCRELSRAVKSAGLRMSDLPLCRLP